jgi:hypothetical protein
MDSENALKRFFFGKQRMDHEETHAEARPWYQVLWLTGVDYFSTLGYQPGIALLAAGALSPVATALLVLVTLFGALPVYRNVASRSYAGQGSIAMLESLLSGWKGKILVLILLGFAATDFIITMTLSSADAALHITENPYLHHALEGHGPRMWLTIGLLALLAAVFLKGFVEAIGLAGLVAIPYLLLNLVVLIRGGFEIWGQPQLWSNWQSGLVLRGDPTTLLAVSALIFPRLALGLSGFETGASVMPLVKGEPGDASAERPMGRIFATRKLLTAAALIMSVMLLLSSVVTTLLIPKEAYQTGGPAAGRAIAFLAHTYLGTMFGTVYDASTILILWFAGASAMAGLLHLIPRYLPRYGLAPHWAAYGRPLVLVLFAVTVLVTWIFDADVEKQAGAYATGVLALILSASFAVALSLWRESVSRAKSVYFWIVTAVFAFTFGDNIITRPDGVVIAAAFIVVITIFSALSRTWRSTELRVSELAMADEKSAKLWKSLVGKKVHLAPLKTSTPESRALKAAEIRKHYNHVGPIAFLHVSQLDNRSEFISPLKVAVVSEGGHFVIEASRAIAIANSIAYVSEAIDPISIFLGLTRKNLVTQALRFLLWGEGETGLLVYAILLRYWASTPEDDVRPYIFLMSE